MLNIIVRQSTRGIVIDVFLFEKNIEIYKTIIYLQLT